MNTEKSKKPLESLLDVTRAIAHGDFSKEAAVDASGVIAQLAGEINVTVRKLREATPTFTETTERAPLLADTAQSILSLMSNSTKTTLDSADMIIDFCETAISSCNIEEYPIPADAMRAIKDKAFDIIAAQSYQDSARQKLQKLEQDLSKIRNSMIEALIVMNIRSKEDLEEMRSKQKMIVEVSEGQNEEKKQDLVDQLLAEFGL